MRRKRLLFLGILTARYLGATVVMTKTSPEIIEVNSQQMEDMLTRAQDRLSDEDALLLRRLVESYCYITDLVEDKNTSIARLRKLLFGAKTEKTKNVVDETNDSAETDTPPSEDCGRRAT